MKLKSDKYKKARGGHSRLLEITCDKCASLVCYKMLKLGRYPCISDISEVQLVNISLKLLCTDNHSYNS